MSSKKIVIKQIFCLPNKLSSNNNFVFHAKNRYWTCLEKHTSIINWYLAWRTSLSIGLLTCIGARQAFSPTLTASPTLNNWSGSKIVTYWDQQRSKDSSSLYQSTSDLNNKSTFINIKSFDHGSENSSLENDRKFHVHVYWPIKMLIYCSKFIGLQNSYIFIRIEKKLYHLLKQLA